MASVFWDAEGILFIDYVEKGKTITREYRVFQKELYNFESLYKIIQRRYTTF
jgi:hypothetical protein